MCALDPQRIGNRGSHRYSFGGAVGALGEEPAWSVLVDPPALMPVMAAIFGTEDFTCDGVGGGDFVLPGATDFQHLHSVSAPLLLPAFFLRQTLKSSRCYTWGQDGSAPQDGKYRDVKLGRRADGSTFWGDLDMDEAEGCSCKIYATSRFGACKRTLRGSLSHQKA